MPLPFLPEKPHKTAIYCGSKIVWYKPKKLLDLA